MLRVSRALLIVSPYVLGACANDGTEPTSSLTIRVVNRGPTSDTVLALAPSPLVVEIRDRLGHPATGMRVRFLALPSSPVDSLAFRRPTYVCPVESQRCASFLPQSESVTIAADVTSDDAGRAYARMQFGVVAGPGAIQVSVPDSAVSTSIPFSTRPGSLARIVVVVLMLAALSPAVGLLTHGRTPYGSALSTLGPSAAIAAPGCSMQICNKPKGSKPAET